MHIRLLIKLFIVFTIACNPEGDGKSDAKKPNTEVKIEFDKLKWSVKEGKDYTYRAQMLDDIIGNDTVRFLDKYEIIALFGEPDRTNDNYLYYTIAQKRLGTWPLHSKTMVIKLAGDTTVDWIKIHE